LTEDRLRRLEDEVALARRKAEYCRHADALDPDLMVSVFTDDCVVEFGPELPVVHGREALRGFYAAALAATVSSSHHLSNLEIDFLDADTARLRCVLHSWHRLRGRVDRHRLARYDDVWVRTADGWFQRSLVYLVAGEFGAPDETRLAEHLGRY
jgi:hypothetical protein